MAYGAPLIGFSLPVRPLPPAAIVQTRLGSITFLQDDWTVIDLWSGVNFVDPYQTDAKPWQAMVRVTAGFGVAPAIMLSVPRSASLCAFGSVFEVFGYNLDTSAALVVNARAAQSGGAVATQNVLEIVSGLQPAGAALVVPPYARRLRWDVSQAARSSAYVVLVSMLGVEVGRYTWAEQPDVGVWLGSVGTIWMYGPAGESGRATFELTL